VIRGPDPQWFAPVRDHFRGQGPLPAELPHASEWSWAGTEFDSVIDNNGSLDELYVQITDLVTDLRPAKANLAA